MVFTSQPPCGGAGTTASRASPEGAFVGGVLFLVAAVRGGGHRGRGQGRGSAEREGRAVLSRDPDDGDAVADAQTSIASGGGFHDGGAT